MTKKSSRGNIGAQLAGGQMVKLLLASKYQDFSS